MTSICDEVKCPFKEWCYSNSAKVTTKEEEMLWKAVCPLWIERMERLKA